MRLKITYKILPFVLFAFLHTLLFNINTAEWGDSYMILRASEYVRMGTYPEDEKRPPLFSVLLAARPANIDPVLWGRCEMFLFGFLGLILATSFFKLYLKDDKWTAVASSLLILNPNYLYWSIRIMADVPFSIIALLVLYLYSIWRNNLSFLKIFILGLLTGAASLTRFEGYLLIPAILGSAWLLSSKSLKVKDLTVSLLAGISKYFVYLLGIGVVLLPYWLFRNPLDSKYLGENEYRAFDLTTVWTYVANLFYIFGFTSAFALVIEKFKLIRDFLGKNLHLTIYLGLELLLILAWPAALPRLFAAVAPVLVLLLTLSIKDVFESGLNTKGFAFTSTALLGFYIASQYILRLQFLVVNKPIFAVLIPLQLLMAFFLIKRNLKLFFISVFISLLLWSAAVIYNHKNLNTAIKQASEYAVNNLSGNFSYNDTGRVADWYLNQKNLSDNSKNAGVSGFYYQEEADNNMKISRLQRRNVDYVIFTNEHNQDLKMDNSKFPWLTQVKEFSYTENGTVFFARILRFNKNYVK